MLEFHLRLRDGSLRIEQRAAPVTLGRAQHCDLRVPGWRIARAHARFERNAAGVSVTDLGSFGGTRVNGVRVAHFAPLHPEDVIQLGPYVLRVRDCAQAEVCARAPAVPASTSPAEPLPEWPPTELPPGLAAAPAQPAKLSESAGLPTDPAPPASAQTAPATPDPPPLAIAPALRQRLHAALLDALDLRRRDVNRLSDAALRREAEARLATLIAADADIAPDIDRQALLRQVVDEAVGLGPLEALLTDERVTEIMVNRHDEIYVEIDGKLARYPGGFSSEQAVLGAIERMIAPTGRRIDEGSPMVDARLADGSRVNAVLAPVALRGAALTIRKFAHNRRHLADLIAAGSLDAVMAQFLALCVRERQNIVVAGGTGAGKTTLLNALAAAIPTGERIVTIEDAAELRLAHPHLVALEARPPNLQGRGAIAIRDLVRNALRMRPDRIVVGECRGGEAFDMLAAMNTGHEGSLTTLHANSPRDALARLEAMILMADMALPLTAIREHIAAGINLIVQQARFADGQRRITAIVEVAGMAGERILLQDLFRYERTRQAFVGVGTPPSFCDAWRAVGIPIAPEWFSAGTASEGST